MTTTTPNLQKFSARIPVVPSTDEKKYDRLISLESQLRDHLNNAPESKRDVIKARLFEIHLLLCQPKMSSVRRERQRLAMDYEWDQSTLISQVIELGNKEFEARRTNQVSLAHFLAEKAERLKSEFAQKWRPFRHQIAMC